jgi:hypothetical protein
MSKVDLSKCFDADGNITFNPYRASDADSRYSVLFAGEDDLFSLPGCLKRESHDALRVLIEANKWEWTCDAIAIFHADKLGRQTDGAYPTIRMYR